MYSHMENCDAHLRGFSAPLASSNIVRPIRSTAWFEYLVIKKANKIIEITIIHSKGNIIMMKKKFFEWKEIN